MAIYFKHQTQVPPVGVEEFTASSVEWHAKYGVLAVASRNGEKQCDGMVSFYHDEVLWI